MKDLTHQLSSHRVANHREIREEFAKSKLHFGISFLDEAMGGIQPIDLVIIGAGSGTGKTDLASSIAFKNAAMGRKVFGIFLEAFEGEIELRQKYKLLAKEAVMAGLKPSFRRWMQLKQDDLETIEVDTSHFANVTTKYRQQTYGIKELEKDLTMAEGCDLIVIDHLHYFDFDGENENRELTKIVKKISDMINIIKTPVILVSHLRKRDKQWGDLIAGLEDFMGTSNITKIATRVITMASLGPIEATRFHTGVRIAKFRPDMSVTAYVASMVYNTELNDYEAGYKLCRLSKNGKDIEEVPPSFRPDWFYGGIQGGMNESGGEKSET